MKYDFKSYLTDIFVETGSGGGDGIMAALDAQFKEIYSIELSNLLFNECLEKFKHIEKVKLYHGKSVDILPKILKHINKRCTFWLDAHYCGEPTAGKGKGIPLMDELKIIAKHPIKNHIVMIDDIRLIRDKEMDEEWKHFFYTTNDIEKFIYGINPDYKIIYDFGEVENDILIAKI